MKWVTPDAVLLALVFRSSFVLRRGLKLFSVAFSLQFLQKVEIIGWEPNVSDESGVALLPRRRGALRPLNHHRKSKRPGEGEQGWRPADQERNVGADGLKLGK